MLYDPRWEQKTKANHYSLANLTAWLEAQPADGDYHISEPSTCLLGQFARAMGAIDPAVTSIELDKTNSMAIIAFGYHFDRDLQQHTFGAALARARKLADAY